MCSNIMGSCPVGGCNNPVGTCWMTCKWIAQILTALAFVFIGVDIDTCVGCAEYPYFINHVCISNHFCIPLLSVLAL